MSPKFILKFIKKLTPSNFFMAIAGAMLSFSKGLINVVTESEPFVMIRNILKVIQSIMGFVIRNFKLLVIVLSILSAILFLIMYWNTIMEGLGGFRGNVIVDIGKMQELNQDTSAYIDMQNTDGLLEAFYDDVSSTSFYQTFNLRDMDGKTIDVFTRFMMSLNNALNPDTPITEEDIFAQRKVVDENGTPVYGDGVVLGFSSFFSAVQYDPRYILTDANKNPVKYLKAAQVLGTNETRTNINAYFRDFYNRESTFTLSPTLLYELNRWAYGDPKASENIVYPEAFTKPIHFVNDYRRIQNDPLSSIYGTPYVYVTKRVTLDDIRDPMSIFYNDKEHEGLIYSTPSDIVWDYAITDTNLYQIKYNTDSVGQVNIGNVSEYAKENITIKYEDGKPIIESLGTGGDVIVAKGGQMLGLGDSLMNGLIAASGGVLVKGAVDGESINQIKNRALNYSNYSVIIISAGTNDWYQPNSVKSNYINLLSTVYANNPNAMIISSNCPYILDSVAKNAGYNVTDASIQEVNTQIALAVSEFKSSNPSANIVMYDLYNFVKSNTNFKSSDGLHLSNGGYTSWWNQITSSQNLETAEALEANKGYAADVVARLEEERLNDTSSQLVKVYWKVNQNCLATHMGKTANAEDDCATDEASNKCFIGPYLTLDVLDNGELVLSDLITDSTTYAGNIIKQEMNKCPRKHLQTAPIFDENGDMLTSSRNLFNKVYVREPKIKESYRNSDEYWSQLNDFIEADIAKSGTSEDENGVKGLCTAAYMSAERALPWEKRQCSILRNALTSTVSGWTSSRIIEFGAWLSHGGGSEDWKDYANQEVNASGIYMILLSYEDYLIATGREGVQWEYKYFATSEEDRLNGLSQFTTISMGIFKVPDFLGIKDLLTKGDKTYTYKNTYQAYLESNDYRTVASEYTPVAIITGNTKLDNSGEYTGINNMGWGWKYDVNTGEIKMTLGEASMELPRYFTPGEADTVAATTTLTKAAYNALNPAAQALVSLFATTKYGDVIYGPENFTRHWENGKIVDNDNWSLIRQALLAGGIIKVDDTMQLVENDDGMQINYDNITDFRNEEYVWNPNATVWRPEEDTSASVSDGLLVAKMVECNSVLGQCGRITTTDSENDYLPMELKSVRDYGLGSVLSYIEGRKVVFKTGISALEDYNIQGVQNYFDTISSKTGFSFPNASTGFYPIQLLDKTYALHDGTQMSLQDVYRKLPGILGNGIEGLYSLSNSFVTAQGTGATSIPSPNGGTCVLNGDYDASQYSISCDGQKTGLYAFIPHITDSSVNAAFKSIFGSNNKDLPDQFWDPMAYYLAWFDYSESFDPDNIWSKAVHVIKEGFSSSLDTSVAAKLRGIQSTGSTNFSGISKDGSFWGNAGTNINSNVSQDFFSKYGGDIKSIGLINESETQRMYLIEEAATFLGEFIYTYKDTMTTTGTMQSENAIIGDIVWADRYYYLSNYIFAQLIKEYKTEISSEGSTGWLSEAPEDELIADPNPIGHWWEAITGNRQVISTYRVYDPVAFDSKTTSCPEKKEGSTEDEEDKCTPETTERFHYKDIIYYLDLKNRPTLNIDSPTEVIRLSNYLTNTGHSDTANKIWMNIKVYGDLSDWGMFNPNATDLNQNIVHDYSNQASVGYVDSSTYPYPAREGDSGKHYGDWAKVSTDLQNRSGLLIEGSEIPPASNLRDGLIDDSNYKVIIEKDGILTDDAFGSVELFNNDDRKYISDAIYAIYGKDNSFITSPTTVNVYGKSFNYDVGAELSDKFDDMLYGINLADRTDEGYPLPLYEHVSGVEKTIMPQETGAYFNGETLSGYKNRITFKENDGINRYNYLINERKNRTSYLYDYLMNFEAYIPLEVKTDGDLQVRGYDSLLAVRVNYNSTVEETKDYTSVITSSVDSDVWAEVLKKFEKTGIDKQAVSQVIAGIMEVSFKEAPYRMIARYNQILESSSKTKIKSNSENLNKISGRIQASMKLKGQAVLDYDEYRVVSLEMEDGTFEDFVIPTMGYGVIDNIGTPTTLGGNLDTANYGSGSSNIVDVQLTINDTQDDRFNVDKSVDYVSTKFARLFNKYSNMSYALMSYFYGEEYWDALIGVLGAKGGSTLDWTTKDTNIIKQALEVVRDKSGATTGTNMDIVVDIELWDPDAVKDVLSYITDTSKRTDAIQVTVPGIFVEGDNVGKNSKRSEDIYTKWKVIIDRYAAEYGVDPAIIAMMWVGESGGNAFSGFCSGDNIKEVCGGVYSESCKSQIRCAGKSSGYNGGGGIGQIDDQTGTGGRGTVNGKSRCISVSGHEDACVKMYNPKTEGPSLGLSGSSVSDFDVQRYMTYDERYDPEKGARWSIALIASLIKSYPDDIRQAVVAYNGIGSSIKEAKAAGREWYDYYSNVWVPRVNAAQQAAGKPTVVDYWAYVTQFYSSNISNGTLTVTPGSSGSKGTASLSAYQNTGALNTYESDKLGLQNTGIEVVGRAGSLSRNDVEMILTSAMKTTDISSNAYEYDIFNFFKAIDNKADGSSNANANPGTWLVSAKIATLGPGRFPENYPDSPFKGMPPLFKISGFYSEGAVYKISSGFGYRDLSLSTASKTHMALDFALATGNPIYPVANGIVTECAYNKYRGYYIRVEHDISFLGDDAIIKSDSKTIRVTGMRTVSQHLNSKPNYSPGDSVSAGLQMAVSGGSGVGTGPHFHFEILLKGEELDASGNVIGQINWTSVDPEPWLTTIWYDESGTGTLPAFNVEYSESYHR